MKKLLFLFIVSMIYLQTYAVPAYPYPITITQPNGDELTLIMKGDEFIHWAVTLDGYTLLVDADSYFCYAQLNVSGDLEPSQYFATEISNRSTEVNSWLQAINKGLFYSNEQVYNYLQLRELVENENEKNLRDPKAGDSKMLIILMSFPDRPIKKTVQDFELLLNQINYTEGDITGSMKDYYLQASYNKFVVTWTVAGPFTAQREAAYYADATGRARDCAKEAIEAAYNSGIDLSEFAVGSTLPSFYWIYAGFDASAGCPSTSCIWAHKFQLRNPLNLGGIIVSVYACSSELRGTSGNLITDIGVICHEFGHSIGASDYYDTNGGTGGEYDGTGDWDIMASGSWNNGGVTPPMHNPRTKAYTYGWAQVTELNSPQTVTIPLSRVYSNAYFRINTQTNNEYFILEYRNKEEFDAYIPGSGLMIYRVHSNISGMGNCINCTHPQGFYPVSAGAPVQIPVAGVSNYRPINSSSCSWPGSQNKTIFDDSTTPSMKSWANANTNKPISNIKVMEDYVTFDFMGGGSKSNYHVFLPSYYGCTVEAQAGSISPVNSGSSFSFKVDLLSSHDKSEITVTANGVTLSPNENVYTITNITSDQIVRIDGVAFNTFPITATAETNGTISPLGDVPVNQGGIQTFEIRADNGCSIDKVVVDGVDKGKISTYTFFNVLEPHTISATFKLGGIYTINTSIDSLYFETHTGIPTTSVIVDISSSDVVTNISIVAPPKFQISHNGSMWSQSFSISKTQLPYKLYVRFNPAANIYHVGLWKGTITLKSTEAYAEIKVTGNALIGIDENDIDQSISIYPNPTTGKLQVVSSELQVTSIEVFDIHGRMVSAPQLSSSSEQELDITNLSAGFYMLAIQTEKGIIRKKVVKE